MLLEWKEIWKEEEEGSRVVSNKSHDRRLCCRGHKTQEEEEEGEEEVLSYSKSRPSFPLRELAQSMSHCEQNTTTNTTSTTSILPLHQLPRDKFIHT